MESETQLGVANILKFARLKRNLNICGFTVLNDVTTVSNLTSTVYLFHRQSQEKVGWGFNKVALCLCHLALGSN